MCFFIQSCEPLEKEKLQKKSTKKKKHIILSWALCPTCLPFLPLSTLLNWQKHDSGQLACGGNPNSAAVWGKVPNRGKSCPLLLFHSWNALGLSAALCSRAGSVPAWDAGASPSALCSSWLQVQSSSWPSLLQVGVVQALLGWAVTLLCSNCKRIGHQLPDGTSSPCPNTHTCWPLLPCVTLPCSAGAGVAVCKLLCITCTVSLSYLSTGCFS